VKVLSRFKGNTIEIRPMREIDIPESRRVGQEAWSDLVSRDIGRKIRYPIRPRRIVETYMWKEPKGCLVVYENDILVGSAFSHVWGNVGWVGPIEILPESQNKGIGRMLLNASEEYLRNRGCQVIGVETMPNMPKNLHFYIMGGYVPRQLTLITEKPVRVSESKPIPPSTRELDGGELDDLLPKVVDLSKQVNPLLDYSIEFKAMFKKQLGQCMVLEHEGKIEGAALLHSYTRSGDSNFCSIKLVLVNNNLPNPWEAFIDLIFACETKALELGRKRIYSRFSGDNPKTYSVMTDCGFRLANSNIRVVKDGDYVENTDFHISSWAG